MTLHEAILFVLQKYGPLSCSDIADKIRLHNLYRQKEGGHAPSGQISARINKYPHLFSRQGSLVLVKGIGGAPIRPQQVTGSAPIQPLKGTGAAPIPPRANGTPRKKRDEDYIIDLCDEILRCKASRQHRFDFLLGDPNAQGKRTRLPVDAYYEPLNLVIEYRERQHTESVPIMDRRSTISGVARAEQRRIYDKRREEILPEHGIELIILSFDQFRCDSQKRLRRDPVADRAVIRAKLKNRLK